MKVIKMKKNPEKDKRGEYFIDDTPPDIESFMATYTAEEIEEMFQKIFGNKNNEEESEEE